MFNVHLYALLRKALQTRKGSSLLIQFHQRLFVSGSFLLSAVDFALISRNVFRGGHVRLRPSLQQSKVGLLIHFQEALFPRELNPVLRECQEQKRKNIELDPPNEHTSHLYAVCGTRRSH